VWVEAACNGRRGAPTAGEGGGRSRPQPDSVRRQSAKAEIETLYKEEVVALRLFVGRTLRNATDCEDIVQDAFVRTWRALAEDRARSPRAVLFKTARNLALNHIRNSRARTCDTTRAALNDAFMRPVATAEEDMIASEQAEGCRQLLEGLPARCREAFMLRVVDELSYHDMSKVMRLSISTIEKHIGKGKQICRERLAEAQRDGDPVLGAIVSNISARSARGQSAEFLLAAE
jgi:RNA polymerase sigma-70 factor (ECF subfamily)